MKNILAIFLILFSLNAFAANKAQTIPAVTNCEAQTPFGYPDTPVQTTLLCRTAYVNEYFNACKVPLLVIENVQAIHLGNPSTRDGFRADTDLPPAYRAKTSDYAGRAKLHIDIGHLANADDLTYSEATKSEAALLSNTHPQVDVQNRGIWLQLESHVRALAMKYGSIYVITGGIYAAGPKKLGTGVCIPDKIYKVIIDTKTMQSIAYIIPNTNKFTKYPDYAVAVEDVEAQTGINFTPKLDPAVAAKMNSVASPDLK